MTEKRRRPTISTHPIPTTNAGTIELHVFEPPFPEIADTSTTTAPNNNDHSTHTTNNHHAGENHIQGTIITVHPWSTLGGGEHNTIGLARHISSSSKWRVITFTMKSLSSWQGGAVWGICSKHTYEVQQIVDVVLWTIQQYSSGTTTTNENNNDVAKEDYLASEGKITKQRANETPIVLLGSSAGAPMAGSAMAQILKHHPRKEQQTTGARNTNAIISAFIAVGYTFGKFASLGFGRHFSSVVETRSSNYSYSSMLLSSICGTSSSTSAAAAVEEKSYSPHKLFIMGENDEFTTVDQLERMASKMRQHNVVHGTKCGNASSKDSDSDVGSSARIDVEVVPNVGHFELESSSYDSIVSNLVMDWLAMIFENHSAT